MRSVALKLQNVLSIFHFLALIKMDMVYEIVHYTGETIQSVCNSILGEDSIVLVNKRLVPVPNKQTHLFGLEVNMLSTKIAGISGAAAVMLSAYTAHKVLVDSTIDAKRKKALKNGNKYHFYHTFALLFANKARYPPITLALFAGGILLFSGPCYIYGFTGYEGIRTFTPYGGFLLILGWMSFLL